MERGRTAVVTAGRLPGAPQGKLPGQLSELEAAFPILAGEGAKGTVSAVTE
ncbi:MAG: hypothetical protein IJI57_14870 [Flexilinea sp.]|nr:hypothetical protein [Flexilinea sp.]